MKNALQKFMFLSLIAACVPAEAEAQKTSHTATQSTITKKHSAKKSKKRNLTSKYRKQHKANAKHLKKHTSSPKKGSSRRSRIKDKLKNGLLIATAPIWLPVGLIALKNHKGGFGVAGCV